MDPRSIDESSEIRIGCSPASLLQSCNAFPRHSYSFWGASQTCNNPEIPHHHWLLGHCNNSLQGFRLKSLALVKARGHIGDVRGAEMPTAPHLDNRIARLKKRQVKGTGQRESKAVRPLASWFRGSQTLNPASLWDGENLPPNKRTGQHGQPWISVDSLTAQLSLTERDLISTMFTKGCRQLKNGKPAGKGKGCTPAEFIQRRGWKLDPKTGLRVYFG
jgi:hypothetical protein